MVGFNAKSLFSKTQYERKLKEWNIGKNSKATNWKELGRIVRKREAEGKESDVFDNGGRIPRKKVCRKIAEYYRPTALEQYGKGGTNFSPIQVLGKRKSKRRY